MNGSKDAFDRFVDTYYGKLFRYSFTVCGHRQDAEEVAQEALMKVFESLDQLRDPERLKPWVFRIAKNACLMKRRKSIFAPSAELSLSELKPAKNGSAGLEIADWSALPDDLAADRELQRALTNAIQQLPEMYRIVFLLRDVEELSTEAAAHVLEVTEDVVKQRLHRARLALRKSLDVYAKEMK
jgi:RNA polymerase sigma-70 factor (ECF subfamily)